MEKLSVVIPAYNEIKNLKGGVLDDVFKYLSKQKYLWEVLVVDDASTDKTASFVENFVRNKKGFKFFKEPHRGKGGTVIAGMLKAQGEIALFCDMDQATPISELDKVLPKFAEGFDIVIGSRSGRKGAPLVRKLMAYGFTILRTLVLGLPFKDTQCGFKAFKKEAAIAIFKRMQIFNQKHNSQKAGVTPGFDLELLYLSRKLQFKVAEVNVVWSHKETERINPIKDSWEGFCDLIRVRINALQGKYGV